LKVIPKVYTWFKDSDRRQFYKHALNIFSAVSSILWLRTRTFQLFTVKM